VALNPTRGIVFGDYLRGGLSAHRLPLLCLTVHTVNGGSCTLHETTRFASHKKHVVTFSWSYHSSHGSSRLKRSLEVALEAGNDGIDVTSRGKLFQPSRSAHEADAWKARSPTVERRKWRWPAVSLNWWFISDLRSKDQTALNYTIIQWQKRHIQSKVFTKFHVRAIDTIAGCHSIVLLIVLESKINKRLVFFSTAIMSGIFTGVMESC